MKCCEAAHENVIKRAGRGRKKAVLQHSPFMPYGDCEFSITAAGVVDAVDG